jgi:hypothetical protein
VAGLALAPLWARADVTDWRQGMLDHYLPDRAGASFSVRQLESGNDADFELWELAGGGYMLVDARTRTMIESSDTATSPLISYPGHDATYLGLGEYIVQMPGKKRINALNRTSRSAMSETQVGEVVHELSGNVALADPLSLTNQSRMQAYSTIPPAVGSNVNFRIVNYSYITGCTVLPNDNDRCGWIAASIVMRYWHARSGKTLIPTAHRSGTNIKEVSGTDFADLIRNGRSLVVGSGLPVAEGMGYHAVTRQKVKADAWYNLLSLNVDSALKADRPVILLGNLPSAYTDKKKSNHAVVAYGKSKDGHNIVHYGYKDKQALVLNSGTVGSNTHFLLK